MRYLRNPNTNPYYNMAFDEYCLESLQLDEPVFYLWQNRPSVIRAMLRPSWGSEEMASVV